MAWTASLQLPWKHVAEQINPQGRSWSLLCHICLIFLFPQAGLNHVFYAEAIYSIAKLLHLRSKRLRELISLLSFFPAYFICSATSLWKLKFKCFLWTRQQGLYISFIILKALCTCVHLYSQAWKHTAWQQRQHCWAMSRSTSI